MASSIELVKKLRAMTHAPLKDCKSAIEESAGDLDRAQEILREKGALKAAKKADRETNEGVVVVKQDGSTTVGVKIACETDFVAKNDTFLTLASDVADMFAWISEDVLSIDSIDQAMLDAADAKLKDNFVTIGENMRLVDVFVLHASAYVYRHPGNKVAAVVVYEGEEDRAKEVALQVAAMNPTYLSVDDVPAADIEAMKVKFNEEMADSGKPADIIEKIVAWKLQKQWKDLVLLEQLSIVDDSQSVKAKLGETTVSQFIRFAI